MRIITVMLANGIRVHAVTEGAASPRVTLCRRLADGATIIDADPDCKLCAKAIAAKRQR
jgi:hypothetical protein